MELALPHWYFFDKYTDKKRESLTDAQVGERVEKERRLFCATCRNLITTQDNRINIQGGQEHTFMNPHGYQFHIGCFRDTRGCANVGQEVSAWSWFRGFTWRITLCGSCETHLGWLFRAPNECFHGLILNRLTSLH